MVDLQETPAVPPEETGGNERAGFQIAGVLLILLGFGLGVLGNLALHARAAPDGTAFGPWVLTPTLGPFAWATLGFGLITGLIGIALIAISLTAPKGPIQLPGYPY